MPQPHVQVVLGGQKLPKGLEAALRRVDATTSFGPLAEVIRSGFKPTADAVVVVADEDGQTGADGLRSLFDRIAVQPRATLVLHAAGSDACSPMRSPLPVTFSDPNDAEELATRIANMIKKRPSAETIQAGGSAHRQTNETLIQQYQQQLRLASQVQRQLLPQTLPRYDGVSLAAVYRPVDYVSGDFFDIRRLNHDCVSVAVVDAQGHGICAALLTVFIRRALRANATEDNDLKPVSPGQVLARLNQELLETELAETQFAAITYALIDLRTHRVELARGGAPYPIIRHACGQAKLTASRGLLVGVATNVDFETKSVQLEPGDSLLIHTDGVDQMLTGGCWPASPLCKQPPPDKAISATLWYRCLQRQGPLPALEYLQSRHDTLRRLGHALDDLAAVAITIDR